MSMIVTMTNLDYLIESVRIRLGDFNEDQYSEPLIRMSLVNGVKFLQKRWRSKYQIFSSGLIAAEQPAGAPAAGVIWCSTVNGYAFLPSGLRTGDTFRNPFLLFVQPPLPIIEQNDEDAIVLAATYLVHLAKLSSSSSAFTSWSTADVKYTNTEASRSMNHVLDTLQEELTAMFKLKIAQPKSTRQPLNTIIGPKVY
jgi:hypothetical protein